MEWLLLVLVVLLIVYFRLSDPTPGYHKLGPLCSRAERSFFGVLSQAVGEEYFIFAKVRVADVIGPNKGVARSQWQAAFNQISARYFDYVLCRKTALWVLAAIERFNKISVKHSF